MNIPEEFTKKITKEEINGLPLYKYEGPINLIKTKQDVPEACQKLAMDPILGFDTETKPSFKKGVNYPPALLQLATSQEVFLFPLRKVTLTKDLANLLADPKIIKTGVAVHDDIRGLNRLKKFTPGGFVDLADIARELGLKTFGLRNLVANFFKGRVSKRAQCSNWGRKELTRQQIMYAATDAWASREIHMSMLAEGFLTKNGTVKAVKITE